MKIAGRLLTDDKKLTVLVNPRKADKGKKMHEKWNNTAKQSQSLC